MPSPERARGNFTHAARSTMPATLSIFTSATGSERLLVPVLSCGTEVHLYTIPRFPVIQVQLRQIKFEMDSPDGGVIQVDGFIKDDPSLNRIYPAELSCAVPVDSTYEACCVTVSFFSKLGMLSITVVLHAIYVHTGR